MTDKPTPNQIKPYLDDLARISIKHGIYLEHVRHGMRITPVDGQFAGYKEDGRGICNAVDSAYLHQDEVLSESGITLAGVSSIDITQLSNHEILGGHSPDLARMLREAFIAGVLAAAEGSSDEAWWFREGFEREYEGDADEYAAKIVGGQG